MKQAWKLVEAAAYDQARAQPLTITHGKPSRSNYIAWRKELELIATGYDVSDTYGWSVDAAGNNYGCLHLTMDDNDYQNRTTITTYVEPTEPAHYDPNINASTPTFQRKQLEEEQEQMKHDFFTWTGASRGMAENLRDAMEEQYYSELKHSIVGYKNVKTLQILEHLDTHWVTMNTREKKKIKADYYKPWDVAGGVALSAFTKALDERKEELIHHNITIDEEDMKEHYMVQMYHSRAFAEVDMKEWENKTVAQRDDWPTMKAFFRDKMALNEAYTNNNEGNESTLYGSSANIIDDQEEKLADMGDQIREYIQQLTQAKENVPPPSSNTTPTTSPGGNAAVDEMNKRMAKLENLISNMCNNNNNNNNNNNRRGGGGNNNNNRNDGGGNNNNNNNNNSSDANDGRRRNRRDEPYEKYRNMGVYCFSCGFHPVGKEHTSKTCGYKRTNHDENATWTNRGSGGSTIWPTKVREDQKTHESYAGKAAPTN